MNPVLLRKTGKPHSSCTELDPFQPVKTKHHCYYTYQQWEKKGHKSFIHERNLSWINNLSCHTEQISMSKGGGFSSLEDSTGRPLKQNLKGNGKFILRRVSFGKYCWQFFFSLRPNQTETRNELIRENFARKSSLTLVNFSGINYRVEISLYNTYPKITVFFSQPF